MKKKIALLLLTGMLGLFYTNNIIGAEVNILPEFIVEVSRAGENWWGAGVQYGRIIQLQHGETPGRLLATFEELNAGIMPQSPAFPIFASDDEGQTWNRIAEVRQFGGGVQSEWQPHLFELSQDVGLLRKGTVLLAGVSIDAAHSTKTAIKLYASEDSGETWAYVSTVAEGYGLRPEPSRAIFEPFLMVTADGVLVVFYADETQAELHSQKIVYRTSIDGINWSETVNVVALDEQRLRPGMPVVTRMGNGMYFMVYEIVGYGVHGFAGNPIYFRTSLDGLNWGDPRDVGTRVVAGGRALGSSPFVGWTPVGSENGTLIVSGMFMSQGSSRAGSDYFISHDFGATWTTRPHPIPYPNPTHFSGYSNSFSFSADGETLFAINNRGIRNVNNDKASIYFAVVRLVDENVENLPSEPDSNIYEVDDIAGNGERGSAGRIIFILLVCGGVALVVFSLFIIKRKLI